MDKAKELQANRIYSRVLDEIKPSAVEIRATTARVNEVMNKLAKITGKTVQLHVAGSIAKGTNLKGNADVDIFMLFPKKTNRDDLVKYGTSYGKRLASGKRDRYEIKYAEHAYVRVFLESVGVRVDLVPALKIDNIEEMGTTVDRTPLHTEFILSHLSSRQKDDVRLLKYLLKAHNIYGAEVRIGGFPGYLCEILIYQFGSFTKLMERAAGFGSATMLDPIGKIEIKDMKVARRFNSSFVVIDPVDRERNVAAGVSQESFSRFVLIARAFVDNPGIGLFYGKGFSSRQTHKSLENLIKESGLDFFLLITKVPDKTEDVVWPQLKKMSGIISEHIVRSGFNIYFTLNWIDKKEGFILFVAPKEHIGSRLLKGPSAFMGNASTNFIKDHSESLGLVVKGETLYALEKSAYPGIKDILEEVAKGGVVEKRKDINLKSARLLVNEIPAKYSETAYVEICKKLSL